uniref:Uncharacterized protein n=1 Tax=Knipowitschia caucasica TaxID=637954 RepID=A0AAV2LJG5_KNICA
MKSSGGPIKRRQDQEAGLLRSEQPVPVQVLLTPNQDEGEANQDPPPLPPPPPPPPIPRRAAFHLSQPCSPQATSSRALGEERGDQGSGVRLCELLQAGGVSVRPLGKHLAISLPSLPLRLWDTPTQSLPPPVPPLPVETARPQSSPVWQPPRSLSPTSKREKRVFCWV